jgi:hypothetical protein
MFSILGIGFLYQAKLYRNKQLQEEGSEDIDNAYIQHQNTNNAKIETFAKLQRGYSKENKSEALCAMYGRPSLLK